jgi:hypothetical protein
MIVRVDFLLDGPLLSSKAIELQCRVIVPRHPAAVHPVENIPVQAERHSGKGAQLFALPPEWRSLSDRNAVRNHTGTPETVFSFRPESNGPLKRSGLSWGKVV